ncbi:MAG: aminotransferase class III-fold pyridoxal phosphate-dependent enzyme [Flavobacteriaceae bacterium]|nr:aminotransferase class III-fold pyridoxal phosphate-dependent enzyme [Flavobacteriaceae bacterium]
MKTFVSEAFGLNVLSVKKINGYANCNYKVVAENGTFIFKTYTEHIGQFDLVVAENKLLLHLVERSESIGDFPKPVAFTDGSYVKRSTISGEHCICRMLSFVEGTFLGELSPTKEQLTSLGTFLAKTNVALLEFKDYCLEARVYHWDLAQLQRNRPFLSDIENPHDRAVIRYFMDRFELEVAPKLPELRKAVIHNDANEWNVLVSGDGVSGLIDFGDVVYTPLIHEVAIALTYILYRFEKDPLPQAIPFLKAYHAELPLDAKELKLLYWLIAARLCVSLCNAAYAKKVDPENNYATSSEAQAWALLKHWLSLNPKAVEDRFLQACGYTHEPSWDFDAALEQRANLLSRSLSLSYRNPIPMEGAAFQYMYDTEGNAFLDAYNNIPHVGHCHPKVVEAGQGQMARLNTNTRYVYDLLGTYAERLLSKFPESLCKVFFVNSGSAASDLAVRLAMAHTQLPNLMVMEHGYHGNTQIGIDISHYKYNNTKGQGQKGHIIKAMLPDTYKGRYTDQDSAGPKYAQGELANIDQVAAFISEPIVGCGGQVPLAPGYLQSMYPAIREQGGLCISDEVQTGFGRLGTWFWGFEAHGVVPDIVILGKPMGNGHPVGAVVTTKAIAASFEKGVEFFSSFGGNPVSCAIGLAVLDVIEEEGLQMNAQMVGAYYQEALNELKSRHPVIGDVRGKGLFLGVELVFPHTKQPHTALAQQVKNALREQHILISTDGPYDNVLKSKPPLCFSKANVDTVVTALDGILEKLA